MYFTNTNAVNSFYIKITTTAIDTAWLRNLRKLSVLGKAKENYNALRAERTYSILGIHFRKVEFIFHLSTWLFLVGMVVLRVISFVNTPPSVSIPSDSGVTSNSNTSLTSPDRTPPWMAAPTATASSGLTALLGDRPKISCTTDCTC